MKVSLCIPIYNRAHMVRELLALPLQSPDVVDEIVIVDDCSEDYEELKEIVEWLNYGPVSHDQLAEAIPTKIKLYRNEKNLGCFLNKEQAVKHATNRWVILFDSDNVLHPSYLEFLRNKETFFPDTIYAPGAAEPNFNYRKFIGNFIEKEQVKRLITDPIFDCLLNTCNYIVHGETYLNVRNSIPADFNPWACDSFWFMYHWFLQGKAMQVRTFSYSHRVHNGSLFMQQVNESMAVNAHIKKLIADVY